MNPKLGAQPISAGDLGSLEVATLAGGCFWSIGTMYNQYKGVISVVSGYTGGKLSNPTYEQVMTGKSGHALAIQITFDPKIVSFSELLQVFWNVHDPTTLHHQGNDSGTQYQSVIYCHNFEQQRLARLSREAAQNSNLYKKSFITVTVPTKPFYPAEAYHRDFYINNPSKGYCKTVVGPKIRRFQKLFRDKLKEDARKNTKFCCIC